MTTKRIIYQRPDGGTSIVTPAPEYVQQLMETGMTEIETIEFIRWKDVPADATQVQIVEANDIQQTI